MPLQNLSEQAQYLLALIETEPHTYTRERAVRDLRIAYEGLELKDANAAFDELLASGLVRAQAESLKEDGSVIQRFGTYSLA